MDGRVSRAQKQRESRRAALLSVAQRIFSEKGYHQTSIDDLILGADVARGTFYLYFESKRAIFEELLEDLFTTLQGSVQRIDVSPGARPPLEQLEATVDRVFSTLRENRGIARILLREAVGIDADFDRRLHDFYGRIEALLARAITTGTQMGLIRECDVQAAARCILGATKEIVQFAFVEAAGADSSKPKSREEANRLGRELIAFALMGLFKSA